MGQYHYETVAGHQGIPLDGRVACRICGAQRHVLGWHLRVEHALTAKTYRQQYSGAPVASDHFRAIKRDHVSDGASHVEFYWTPERIIAAIRRWEQRTGALPSSRDWKRGTKGRSRPCASVVRSEFGSWNAAIAAAGFEPRARGGGHPRHNQPYWTRERIVAAAKKWEREYGRPPSSIDWWRSEAGRPAYLTVRNVFGSWATMLAAAGSIRHCRNGLHVMNTNNLTASGSCRGCQRAAQRAFKRRRRTRAKLVQLASTEAEFTTTIRAVGDEFRRVLPDAHPERQAA